MKDIRIIFVLPEAYVDETQCSDIMQSSFEYCKQNVPSEVEWLRESALQSLELKKTDFVIFDEFEGECFNYVNSTKCAVLGPRTLSFCLIEGKAIPNFDWPIYNVAMYDCIVTCSFLPKEVKLEMKDKIQLMGGYYSESLLEKTTHLIAGSAKSQKYLAAAETGKKLMCTSWVEDVWNMSQTKNIHADHKEFDKHRCPPFHNLVICSSGITDLNDKRKIESLVNDGGGKFTGKLRIAETDFLVCSGDMANSAKYKAARQSANIRCVNVSWVIDSVEKGYALPHEPYQIQKITSTPTKVDCPINPDFSVLSAIGNATAAQMLSIDDTNMPGRATTSPANNKRKVTEVWEDLIENLNINKAKRAGQYLDGLSVLLVGFNNDSLEKLHKIINLSGATRYDSFSERVTHVIVGDSNNQELTCIKNKNTSAIIVSLYWLIECIEQQLPVNEEKYLIYPDNENSNLGSPLSKKGLSLLQANRTATRSELENDTNDEISMHGRDPDTNVSDTLGNLLGGISNSGLCKAVQQIEPMESDQFREISLQDTSSVPLTQDAESEIDKFFDHLHFLIFDFCKDDYRQLKDLIVGAGGRVVDKDYKGNIDYVVVPIFNKKKICCSATEVVNLLYIEECIRLKELILSPSYYHKPFVLPDTKPLKNCVITTSTYVAQERIFLQDLIEGLGAICQDLFSRIDKVSQNLRANTHLVSPEAQGKKYNAAQKWGLPAVNKDWLIECARTGKKVDEKNYRLDKSIASKNKEQSGNWSSQTGGVSTLNAASGSQESKTHSSTSSYCKKLLSSIAENVPTTPVSETAKKEYAVPPMWSLMKTPDTPYGTFLTPNPSPNTRKQFAYWLEQMPDRPSPDSNKSTPLSEIKRQLEKRCNEIGKFRPLNFDDLNNSELSGDKEETNKEDKTKENELLDSKFQELENLLGASRATNAGRRQSKNVGSYVPLQANPSEFQDSPPCTVEWDYKTQETRETNRKVFSISGIDDLSVKTKMLERLEQLGGAVSHSSNYDPLCTHLICVRPIRNEKALSCMAAGKWILHISYLEKSFEAGYLLNEDEYEFGNPKAIGKFYISSDTETEVRMKMMHRWRQEIGKRGYGAFNDMRAIIVASKSEPIARVIEAGGGVVVNVEPPFEGNIFATHCLLEMKTVKNLEDYIPLAQQGIFVVNTVYISDFLHEPRNYLEKPKMSFRVVRTSKFRHVYGQALKREQCYDNIRVSKSSWDSTFCAVNPKFLAIIVESAGGGAFIVLPHNKVGRIAADHPLVGGHKGPVLDIAWCPHNDNVIASGSEDCVVKVWHIPDHGLIKTLTEPVVDLIYHQRRVGLVLWHPTALNVLLTAGSDNHVVIWNVGTGEALVEINCHPDIVYSACFNWDGSKLLTTCKDKKIRIINPRNGEVETEAIAHDGTKATRAIFLRHGLVFTTGFSKMSERQYSLRTPDCLEEPIVMVELDTSNGVMFPLYDPDTNLVYLCGKGDSVIRYFEITAEPPFVHYINTFQTPDPQRGIGMMPKRGCDVTSCEISRFYRLNNSGLCQVITMTVPRKSELFQEDLYPDTIGDQHALTADEWIGGRDAEPILISLKDGYKPPESKSSLSVSRRSNLLDKGTKGGKASQQSSPVSDKTLQEFADEIRKLKAVIVKLENRLRAVEGDVTVKLENRVKELEAIVSSKSHNNDDDDGAGGGDGLNTAVLASDEV